MTELIYSAATEKDIPFISETYEENMAALHGNPRTCEKWKELLSDKDTLYCIVHIVRAAVPVGWFRIESSEDTLWLGMLQVKPAYQRRGVGKYVLSVAEDIAKEKGFCKIGIHTTEDNIAARALYLSAGYAVTEIGPCTTADGVERVGYTFQKGICNY